MAAIGAEWQFTTIVKVDTHIRKMDLLVVYTNDPVVVVNSINTLEQLLAEGDKYKVVGFDLEYTGVVPGMIRRLSYTNDPVVVVNSINMLEQLLAEDDKYKVVGFDFEYTGGRARHDQKLVVTQLCMHHHVLVYHNCLAKRPCVHFAKFVNRPDYRFTAVDTTNDLKVLKTSGLSCQKLVSIQGQYRVWSSEKKKRKDTLVDLTEAIIDAYYRDMKAECDKDKFAWHMAWVNKLDEEHIKYMAKDTYTSYEMYRRIVDMRKCLLPADGEG